MAYNKRLGLRVSDKNIMFLSYDALSHFHKNSSQKSSDEEVDDVISTSTRQYRGNHRGPQNITIVQQNIYTQAGKQSTTYYTPGQAKTTHQRAIQPATWGSGALVPHTSSGRVQADQRCFGEYRCHGCGRTWTSASSWRNKGQQCQKCNTNVMAHIQRPLGVDPKAHQQHLCQKCKELGGNCMQESVSRNHGRRQSNQGARAILYN